MREYLLGGSGSLGIEPESIRLNLMGRMDSGLKQASTLPQARVRI